MQPYRIKHTTMRRNYQSHPSFKEPRVNVVVLEDVPKNGLRHRIAKRHKTESSKDFYVFDSGGNQSILFNKEKLSNYLPFSTTMSTADNGTLMCIRKGDLVLNNSITAMTVLYCPQEA